MVNLKYVGIGIVVLFIIIGAAPLFTSSSDNDTVSIGYLPTDHDAALFVANASDMYTDAGLKIELHEYNNGGDLMTAMASGTVDVGYVGITPVLSSIQKGVPVKIVAGAQTEGSGLVSKDSNVKSIEDLKGKSIATPGEASIQYMLLKYDLKKHNMSIDDITSPSMKVASMNDALKTGSIDAMLSYEPYVSIASEVNNENLVETSGEILSNHPCCVVAVSQDFLDKHPNQVKQIIDIHKKATEKLESNPEGCVEYLPKTIVHDANLEKKILSNMSWVSDLNDTYKQDIHTFMDTEKDMGLLNDTITDDKLFYTPS